MTRYNKAIAAIVGAVAASLAVFNIDMSDATQATVITVCAGLVTLLAPKNSE